MGNEKEMRITYSILTVAFIYIITFMFNPAAEAQFAADLEKPGAKFEPEIHEEKLHKLGQDLAEALGQQGARHWLQLAISGSPFVEQRVALNRLILNERPIRSRELLPLQNKWFSSIKRFSDLELYFPIPEQRSEWSEEAAAEIIPDVAVPLAEDSGYIVYSHNGSSWQVGSEFYPSYPTLLLATSEIDYNDLESALKGGRRTGSYLETLSPTDPPSSDRGILNKWFDPSSLPYLTSILMPVNKDPFRGSMEIDIFSRHDFSPEMCSRITGVHAEWPRSVPLGQALLAFSMPTNPTVLVMEIWEDDDQPCVRRNSDDYYGTFFVSEGQLGGPFPGGPVIPLFHTTVVGFGTFEYQAHVQNIGWMGWVPDGALAGTTGQGRRMEAIRIRLVGSPPGIGIEYQAHVQNIGWMNWVANGSTGGTTGQSLRMEAIRIRLINAPPGYGIQYQVFAQGIGWTNWVANGGTAGTTGQSRQIEAIRIRLIEP